MTRRRQPKPTRPTNTKPVRAAAPLGPPPHNQADNQAGEPLEAAAAAGPVVSEPVDACRVCGATAGKYTKTTELPIVGVDAATGAKFDTIVWGVVICEGCGQRRSRRRYELRGDGA